jgi:hypothetical protein
MEVGKSDLEDSPTLSNDTNEEVVPENLWLHCTV